jgi:hypothetical protein
LISIRFIASPFSSQNINSSMTEQRCQRATLVKRRELPEGSGQASGGLDLGGQGTWMGARRRKRGRAAGNAATGVRFRG